MVRSSPLNENSNFLDSPPVSGNLKESRKTTSPVREQRMKTTGKPRR